MVGAPENAPFENYEHFLNNGRRFRTRAYNLFRLEPYEVTIAVPQAAPAYPRILSEQAGEIIANLPHPDLVSRVNIIDGRHWLETWRNQEIRVFALPQTSSNEVDLYEPSDISAVRESVINAWTHLFSFSNVKLGAIFEAASHVEPLIGVGPRVAGEDAKAIAILSEFLLGGHSLLPAALALGNPIKASVFALALGNLLSSIAPERRSTDHDWYLKLVAYIKKSVEPDAFDLLNEHINQQDKAIDAQLLITKLKR